ncbi:DAK1 DegV-like protein [Phlebopus sp. FC_14]|nr:DAK1 DegV-like protein [Phlebopus sp. FC_14]
MTEKHIFESPEGLVLSSLRGVVAQNPALRLHVPTKTVYTASPSAHSGIAVISGGGAGHEPAHAGYTGHGMLTSSVSGDIFASPSARQILAAIEFAAFAGLPRESSDTPASSKLRARDVLIIINNYTGDRLNFGLAIEQARARHPQLNIVSVLNADDVSLLPQSSALGFGRPSESQGDQNGLGESSHVGGSSMVGPRGLGGNILVCKVLGGYVAFGGQGSGASTPTLARAKLLGDALVAHLRSVGATLGHCHVPGRDGHSDTEIIPPCEIELGLGLHNEPGVRRVPLSSPQWLVTEMVRALRGSAGGWDGAEIHRLEGVTKNGGNASHGQHNWIREGDEVVLFINNLGGMSTLEMGAVVEAVRKELESHHIVPSRVYSAPYMTSLNAPGFSISLVNVTRVEDIVNMIYGKGEEKDPIDVLALLDAPTDATAWVGVRSWPARGFTRNAQAEEQEAEETLKTILSNMPAPSSQPISSSSHCECDAGASTWGAFGFTPREVVSGLRGACEAVLEVEGEMTRFDTVVGDGDCGETFAGGARAILSALSTGALDSTTQAPHEFVAIVGKSLEGSMGGTIGALFAIFFTAWSVALRATKIHDGETHSPLNEALLTLGKHTPARPGDRTVVDALAPLCASLVAFASQPGSIDPSSSPTSILTKDEQNALHQDQMFDAAVRASKYGAESTRGMSARLGRASYVVGGSICGGVQGELPPDPGAWGVAAIVEGFVRGVRAARG